MTLAPEPANTAVPTRIHEQPRKAHTIKQLPGEEGLVALCAEVELVPQAPIELTQGLDLPLVRIVAATQLHDVVRGLEENVHRGRLVVAELRHRLPQLLQLLLLVDAPLALQRIVIRALEIDHAAWMRGRVVMV